MNEHAVASGSPPSLPEEVLGALRTRLASPPLARTETSPRRGAWDLRPTLPTRLPLAGKAWWHLREAGEPPRDPLAGHPLGGGARPLLRAACDPLRLPLTAPPLVPTASSVRDLRRARPTDCPLAGRVSPLPPETSDSPRAPLTSPLLVRARRTRRPLRAAVLWTARGAPSPLARGMYAARQ